MRLTDRPTSIDDVNEALRERGYVVTLREADGGGYVFEGGGSRWWPLAKVLDIDTIGDITIGAWLIEHDDLKGRISPTRSRDHEITEVEPVNLGITHWVAICSCGWRSSASRKQVAASNGGRAHIRAQRKKEV